MKVGSRVRALMLVLTFLVLATPFASAQIDLAATPEVEAPIETPIVEETPVVETTPEVTPDVTAEPEVVDPQPDGDGAVTPEAEEGDEPATTPESSPQTQAQSRAGDVEIMATRFVTIDLVTWDGGAVPAGTQVCIWNSEEWCQPWEGEALTFSPFSRDVEFWVEVPSDSDYDEVEGWLIVPTGAPTLQTITLHKKATVEFSVEVAGGGSVPAGTEVCVWGSDEGCLDWEGTALTFSVPPGTVEYEVRPGSGSGFANAFGTIDVAPGASVAHTATLEAPGTLNVTVVTADGGTLPGYVDVTVPQSLEYWGYYEGTPLTFHVTPGDVAWEVYLPWDSRYHETSGTISVASGESVDLVITLEPKDPGSLRVYLSTDLRQPVPAGTVVCIDMPAPESGDPIEGLCQTATGDSVFFPDLDRGDVDVTVTPPLGSGYLGGTWTYHVELGQTTRVWVALETGEEAFDATVEMTIRMSDGSPALFDGAACLVPGTADELYLELIYLGECIPPGDWTDNPDGSVTLGFQVPAGTYQYFATSTDGLHWAQGTVTAVSRDVTSVEIVFNAEPGSEKAIINASVETLVGEPVPAGTMLCVVGLGEAIGGDDEILEFCHLWTGAPIVVEVNAGPIVVAAIPPEDSDYRMGLGSIYKIVRPGQSYDETVILYPYEFDAGIEMIVSDEAPQSGDTVTYTIRAYGSAPMYARMAESGEAELSFEITDVLPDELSDMTVTCSGTFLPSVPSGTCADLEGNNLSVFGMYWLDGVFDVTVTVTGTITGEPGTVVTNTAYLHTRSYGEDVNSNDLDVNMVASTSLSAPLFQIAPDLPSASATLVIAGQVPVDPTPTPDPTPSPTPDPVDPTPSPTPDPVDPTPDPAEPGGTPTPGQTPAPGETPAAAETPAAVTALPNTGAGGNSVAPMLTILTLAAASLLAMGGMVIRSCAGHGRG
jgi:hypothetical protein